MHIFELLNNVQRRGVYSSQHDIFFQPLPNIFLKGMHYTHMLWGSGGLPPEAEAF